MLWKHSAACNILHCGHVSSQVVMVWGYVLGVLWLLRGTLAAVRCTDQILRTVASVGFGFPPVCDNVYFFVCQDHISSAWMTQH